MAGRDGPSLAAVYDRVAAHLVGRERELTLVLAAVAAGRDIILEGPPGTSKSTLLRAITAEWGIPMVFVEGNTDLTPSKLIGNVGTTRLSTSVHDRICRLAIGYQDAAAERGIVALRAPLPSVAPGLYQRLVADAVAGTRATREHPDIRQGSSVRGAIDLTLVAGQLLELHGPGEYAELVYDAMVVALSGRIFLDETVDAEPRLLDVSGRGGAGDLVLTGDRGGRPGGPRAGSGGPALTTERSGLSAVPDGEGPDPEALRRARQIAARLAVPRPRRDVTARRGLGELASLRYRGGSDDIDLDRTVAQLVEHPLPDEDDIIVRVAARELARVPARDARAVLLSDCVHNAGPDPRPFAARLPRLDVLLDTSGEQDAELARELARLGHGRLRRIGGYTYVAPALGAIFTY